MFGLHYWLERKSTALVLAILLDHHVLGRAVFRNVFLFPYSLSFIVTGVSQSRLT